MNVQSIGPRGKPYRIVHHAEPYTDSVWTAKVRTDCGRKWVAGNAQILKVTEEPVTCLLCIRSRVRKAENIIDLMGTLKKSLAARARDTLRVER